MKSPVRKKRTLAMTMTADNDAHERNSVEAAERPQQSCEAQLLRRRGARQTLATPSRKRFDPRSMTKPKAITAIPVRTQAR